MKRCYVVLGKYRKRDTSLKRKKKCSLGSHSFVGLANPYSASKTHLNNLCLGSRVCSKSSGVDWQLFPLPLTRCHPAPHFCNLAHRTHPLLPCSPSACHPPPARPRTIAVLSLCCHHLDGLDFDFFQCHPLLRPFLAEGDVSSLV